MPVRLVVSDVDGTLVRSDKTLADATIRAVGVLRDAGIPMSLISARPPSGLRWIVDALDLDGPFGAFNGGTLFDRRGTLLQQHFVEPRVVEVGLGFLRRAGVTIWVFAGGRWLASDVTNVHVPRERRSAGLDPVLTLDFTDVADRTDKIVAVSDEPELMARLEHEVRSAIGTVATVARSQSYYLDITATLANKGDGVSALARALSVPVEEIAVFGDQANDLPMFVRAGLSIAMGQGPQLVRSAATWVSTSNDQDGVARAIEYILTQDIP